MPELPEVETVARGVDVRLRGDRIEAVWFGDKKEPFKSPARTMARILPGKRVERVFRVGKHIVFDLAAASLESVPGARDAKAVSPEIGGRRKKGSSHSAAGLSPRSARRGAAQGSKPDAVQRPRPETVQWTVHLGMTGRLLVASPADPIPAHTHAILRMASGRELRFVDPRRFGRLALHAAPSQKGAGFAGSGREPLAVSPDEFAALFAGARTSIKAALLDQSRLQGVGNIYADESLFRAGIRPRRRAAGLSRKQMDRLRQCLQDVLREAIALGGSSVSDYVDAAGARGFFQLEHKVYQRANLPCLVCGTPIRRVVVAGRGTHYCSRCQA